MMHHSIVDLYTDLANNPDKDFGWDKGMQNALNHGYKEEWIKAIPEKVWRYCAAVGNPFDAGEFHAGESVLDIGCGAGVDLCVASLLVGKTGSVFGVDFTPAMVERSRNNAKLAALSNITVHENSITKLPYEDDSINTVISNGAINLASAKDVVFSEVYRVLAHGGQFCFADMIKDNAHLETCGCEKESWADCVAGTLRSGEVIQLLEEAGFIDVQLLGTNHYKTSSSTIGATFRARKE
jgi:SAM-dependent methyltransferase